MKKMRKQRVCLHKQTYGGNAFSVKLYNFGLGDRQMRSPSRVFRQIGKERGTGGRKGEV